MVKVFAFQELDGSKDSTEHVTAESHVVVNFIGVYDPQKDKVGIYFIDSTCYLAQDVSHYPQNVIRIYLVDLLHLHQPMVVVYIRAHPLLYCLQLSQDLLRPETTHYLRHLVNGVEEVTFNLQLDVDLKQGRGQQGSRFLQLFEVDSEGSLATIDNSCEHTEQITVVYHPYLLN